MNPLIGVTSIPRRADTAFAHLPHETVPEMYLEMLQSAGAVAVVIPVHGRAEANDLLPRLDGVLLTGGGDVDPTHYGRDPHPETYGVDPDRDRLEIDLVRGGAERHLPMLAICRGIQVMNVALGGTLVQDIETEVPGGQNHWQLERWGEHVHSIDVETDSRLAEILGSELAVNSMHHQAVAEVGSGLRPVGRAPDGVIEAIEAPDLRYCVGLQWHPETLGTGDRSFGVFQSFVDAAGESRW